VLHTKRENDTMKILLANKEKSTSQIAYLQFAQANTETPNCKRAISSKTEIKKKMK